ncbi:hypothetical protein GLE_0520 [Lysobacter enzymogenes]|uniref:Uncharacterized protein n=1 Tax=Lysobacter enzymogenes TaxID=69 RepID=A0A0S2DBH7_LYSEN|nr:hypothetical protein GLE_0520 [Lysobacter enzymogenes]
MTAAAIGQIAEIAEIGGFGRRSRGRRRLVASTSTRLRQCIRRDLPRSAAMTAGPTAMPREPRAVASRV